MSDSSTEMVAVAREDLVELVAHLRAADMLAVFLNGNLGPSPSWDFDIGWLVREKYLMPGFDPDSGNELQEPVFIETEKRADEIVAGLLEGMLNDPDEMLGLASLFSDERDRTDWLPVATVRRQMRQEIKRLRQSEEVMTS